MTTPDTNANTAGVCWRIRDCSPEVQQYCQHAVSDYDMCPATCKFAVCLRPEHRPTWDPKYVFEPNIDRNQALKHNCIHCEFFIINGPKHDKNKPKELEFADEGPSAEHLAYLEASEK